MSQHPFENAIVRFHNKETNSVIGAGFLIAPDKIITCCHVVADALGIDTPTVPPSDTVYVDFAFVKRKQFFAATVSDWIPKTSDEGDIAVLTLTSKIPENAQPVKVSLSTDLADHGIRTYGFPQGFDQEGRPASGTVAGKLTSGRYAIRGNTTEGGVWVEAGFSGAPVWDRNLNVVIGMIVTVDTGIERAASFIPATQFREFIPAENVVIDELEPSEVTEPSETQPDGKWLQRVDIFISSPSDVAEEREAVLRVIERLNRLSYIRKRYVLNPLLYEKEVPPQAGDYAQMIVDRYMAVEDSYLLVCMMWDRMGTPFTHPQTREDYESGTAYEWEVGYRANQKGGKPHLLLYRKNADNPAADADQKAKVDRFFKRFEGANATFKGLYKQFTALREFETMLFEHIERILHDNPPDGDRPEHRIDPDTRPEIVEETRRLDAAMPRECQVGRSTEVRVMICLPESEGLRALLPDTTAEGDLIDKRDVEEGNLAVAFPVNQQTGRPEPITVSVEVKSIDFNFHEPIQEIQLSLTRDSGALIFSATPHSKTRRGRVHVTVKSRTPEGYTVTYGSVSIDSHIVSQSSKIIRRIVWGVLSIPLSVTGVPSNYRRYDIVGGVSGGMLNIGGQVHFQGDIEFHVPANTRKQVFVSYSHKDRGVFQRIINGLTSLTPEISIWDDSQIKGGENWQVAIQNALEESNIVLVLVSRNLLASDYIIQTELPELINRAKSGEIKLLWIPVEPVSTSNTPFDDFQSLIPSNQTIASMTDAAFNKVLAKLVKEISRKV
jgi:hypothetical protein